MELTKRQQEIIDAAVALIADKGIQNLTIKNLSHDIGISEPAIYRHFASKFEILMAVLSSFEKIAGHILDSDEIKESAPLEKIKFFLFDRYKRCTENPKLAKVMFSDGNFQSDARLAAKELSIMHIHRAEMHTIITAGQESGEIRGDIDPTSLFRIIFGSMRLLIKQWCLSDCKFDLVAEGGKLWDAEKKIIKK